MDRYAPPDTNYFAHIDLDQKHTTKMAWLGCAKARPLPDVAMQTKTAAMISFILQPFPDEHLVERQTEPKCAVRQGLG